MRQHTILGIVLLALCAGCNPSGEFKTTGSIERLDPALDSLIAPGTKIEIIAEGFDWSEGPLWLESGQMLLFSDVPKNTIYKWTEEKGSEVYLAPSGYTGTTPRGGEMGSNGLLLDKSGNLVLCQHGDRRLAVMSAPLNAPKPEFKTIASGYDNKRFNSPNDAVYHDKAFYMTDPFYGLEKRAEDPLKEIAYQGVYRVSDDGSGTVQLLIDSLTCPNGIAFFPDGKHFIVANSDPQKARWYQCDLSGPTLVGDEFIMQMNWKVFYDATALTATEKGLPDGMKIDRKGNIFATGPGGVFIFNTDGKLLGKIKLPEAASNCALSTDEKTLYVTNDMYILRIKLR